MKGDLLVLQRMKSMDALDQKEESPRPRGPQPGGGVPLVVFDGDCGFCFAWIAWCRERVGGSIRFEASRDVAWQFPEIPEEDFRGALQWIEPDGRRLSGADAVVGILARMGVAGRAVAWIVAAIPGMRGAARFGYGWVARYRKRLPYPAAGRPPQRRP